MDMLIHLSHGMTREEEIIFVYNFFNLTVIIIIRFSFLHFDDPCAARVIFLPLDWMCDLNDAVCLFSKQ